jgi:hypothetical protein
MSRYVHAQWAWVVAIAGVLTLAVCASPASAATECAEKVIGDWSDNGRVDGVYALSCYQEAVDAIPSDLRDYTNAAEVIGRALTTAVRQNGGEPPSTPGDATVSDASAAPVLPVVVAVFALALILAGAAAYAARRRRAT